MKKSERKDIFKVFTTGRGLSLVGTTISEDLWVVEVYEGWYQNDPPLIYLTPVGEDYTVCDSQRFSVRNISQLKKLVRKHAVSKYLSSSCKCFYCKNKNYFERRRGEWRGHKESEEVSRNEISTHQPGM